MIKRSESNVQSKTRRKKSDRKKRNRRLTLEGLENRQLLAAAITPVIPTVDLATFTGPRNIGTVQAFSFVETELSNQSGVNDLPSNATVLPLGNLPGQESTIDVVGSLPFTGPITNISADLDTYALDLKAGDILDIAAQGAAGSIDLFHSSGLSWLYTDANQGVFYPADSPLQTAGNAVISQVVPEDGRYFLTVSPLDTSTSYTLGLRTYRPVIESAPIGTQQIVFLDLDGAVYANTVFNPTLPAPGIVRIPSLREGLPLLGIQELDDVSYNQLIDQTLVEVEKQFQTLASNGSNGDYDSTGVAGEFGVTVLNSRDHVDPGNNPLVTRVILGGSIADAGIATIGISSTLDVGNFSMDDVVIGLLDSIVGGVTSVQIANTRSVLDASAQFLGLLVTHEAGHSFGARHTNVGNATPNIMDSGGSFAQAIGAGDDGIYGTLDDVEVEFVTDRFAPEGIFGTNFVADGLSHTLATGTVGGTISGTVFDDANRNRSQLNEPGIAGVTVFADTNANGLLDSGEPRTTTSASGSFALTAAAGTYTVIAQIPTGFTSTTGNALTASTGNAASSLSFGFARTNPDITGTKFSDDDGDGVHDAGEAGIEGVYIYLDLDGDDRPDLGEPSDLTDANGQYSINFPGAGNYTIREVVTPGFSQTYPVGGEHNVTYNGISLGNNYDFGNQPTRDFGDAPDSYLTTTSVGGASHGIIDGLTLGSVVDREVNGSPTANALGDDTTGPVQSNGQITDDEDGVVFTELLGLGGTSQVNVSVVNTSGSQGYLQGWIDFDGDGSFNGANEQVFSNVALATGSHALSVTTPATATIGDTYARFRYSQATDLGFAGATATGEVEDYQITIAGSTGVVQDDVFNVPRNSLSVPLDVLVNDFQTASNQLTITAVDSIGIQGTVTIAPGGKSLIYTPPNNFLGRDEFQYQVTDQLGNVNVANVVVNVTFQTLSPIAIDDALFVPQNSSNRSLNVLDNDIASLNGGLTITSVTAGSAGGNVSVVGGGQTLRYTPQPGFAGTEQFIYSIQDAAGQVSQATVTVNLTPSSQDDDKIHYTFVATDVDNGTDLANQDIKVGDFFDLSVYVEDLRNFELGVASGFLDILYTDELLSVVKDSVSYGPLFEGANSFQLGNADTPGLLNEFGATQVGLTSNDLVEHTDPVRLLTVRVQAVSPGVATFQADPSDLPVSESILIGEQAFLVPSEMRLGSTSVTIIPDSDNTSSAIDDSYPAGLDSNGNAISYTNLNAAPTVNVLDVLNNDLLGPTGQVQEFGIVTNPGLGSVAINDNGTTGFVDDNGTPSDTTDDFFNPQKNDDFIEFTPNLNANGFDSFEYVLVTGDGVRSTATVSFSVGTPTNQVLGIDFEFVDRAGNLITQANVGQEIGLRIDLDDLRGGLSETFAFAAFLDVLYDTNSLTPIVDVTDADYDADLGFSVAFGDSISEVASSGLVSRPGIIDEFGSIELSAGPDLDRPDPRTLATIYFEATAVGTTAVVGSPADLFPFHDSLLYLLDTPVDVSQIRYDTASITIGAAGEGEGPVQNTALPPDVNNDGSVSALDALLVINDLSRSQRVSGESAPLLSSNYMLDVNGDDRVSVLDALNVVNYISRAQAAARGEGEALAVAPETDVVQGGIVTAESSDAVFASIHKVSASAGNAGDEVPAVATVAADSLGQSDDDDTDVLSLLADDVSDLRG